MSHPAPTSPACQPSEGGDRPFLAWRAMARLTLLLDEHHRVQQARLHIVEFRGFESFIVGRPYWEVPQMVQRLCGICPVSHHLAASKAIDVALGIAAVPRTAEVVRRLMHYGQVMQSTCPAFLPPPSPTCCSASTAMPRGANILGVAAACRYCPPRRAAQVWPGGDTPHGRQARARHRLDPWGVNRHLTRPERDELAAQVPQMLDWCEQAVELVARLHSQNTALYEDSAASVRAGCPSCAPMAPWNFTTARCVCAMPMATSCTMASTCRTTWT